MRNKILITSLLLLTGCEGSNSVGFQSLSSSSDPQSAGPAQSISATSVVMTKYLYVMADGGIRTIPIDSASGDLIDPSTGGWWVKPLAGTGNFYTMAMNSNGKMIYALLRNTSLQSKIYQYSISDVTYAEYGTARPLTENATKAATNVVPGLLSWGNNGKLFIQNYNYTPTKVDSYSINASTFLLSAPTTVGSQTTATTTYGLNFVRITQVGYDNHSYVIDTQTNRVIHYVDGVISQSFDIGAQGALTDLAIQ